MVVQIALSDKKENACLKGMKILKIVDKDVRSLIAYFRESISNNSGSSWEESTCSDIPSGLVIEMLVTDAGKYAGVPQMEIVGTRIR